MAAILSKLIVAGEHGIHVIKFDCLWAGNLVRSRILHEPRAVSTARKAVRSAFEERAVLLVSLRTGKKEAKEISAKFNRSAVERMQKALGGFSTASALGLSLKPMTR